MPDDLMLKTAMKQKAVAVHAVVTVKLT